MNIKTVTVEQLITEYAALIADATGLDIGDYDKTAAGLAELLSDAADELDSNDPNVDNLIEASTDLADIARLSGGPEAQKILQKVDRYLEDTKSRLEEN